MTDPEGDFTLRQIAANIARLEGLNPEAEYQRCRSLYQRDLFKPSRRDATPTGAAYFSFDVMCRLRLMLPLKDTLGVSSDALKRLDDLIRVEEVELLPNGTEIKTGLRAAIAGIRRGEDWTLAASILRNTETGETEFSARLRPSWLIEDPTAPEFRRDMMFPPPFELRAFIKIPATELLRPLLVEAD